MAQRLGPGCDIPLTSIGLGFRVTPEVNVIQIG
jgi:hypothetical protein